MKTSILPFNKSNLIEQLELEPHIEGGYFRRTYCSTIPVLNSTSNTRYSLSSIFYLLTDDSPIGHLHRNQSDIVHYFHGGSPLSYWILDLSGELKKVVMGYDLQQGQCLQLTVAGGCWKATELEQGEFALISEAVSPSFDYCDMELAQENIIKQQFPQYWNTLKRFIKAD